MYIVFIALLVRQVIVIDLPAAFLATLVQLKTIASCQTDEQLFFNPIKTFMNFSIIDCEWPVVV